jgi:hypothetical protein
VFGARTSGHLRRSMLEGRREAKAALEFRIETVTTKAAA